MRHRAAICLCRLSQSFRMPTLAPFQSRTSRHPSILSHIACLTQFSLARECFGLSFRFCQWEQRHLLPPRKWLGKHSSECRRFVKVRCQVGRKEGEVCSHLASFCAFFAAHSLAGLRAKMSQVTELSTCQWQSIPGTPRREENGSCFPSNSYHQLQALSSRETIWVYHSVFALWCGPDSAENIVVSSFSSVQPIWCLDTAMLCNRPWKSNVRHDYRSQVP